MAEQEHQITADMLLDTPVSGRSRTARAVALSRLLHQECNRLLELYKERESFLSGYTPGGGRILSLSPDTSEETAAEEQVRLLHSALRQCLGLLHCLILKEEEEMGVLEGEYEAMRKNVHSRLEHLLRSTGVLLQTEDSDSAVDVTPDNPCTEVDGATGSFAVKMWTYRVLQELIHWANHATLTLHVLHKQSKEAEEI